MKDLRQLQFAEIFTTAVDNNCAEFSLHSSIQSWHLTLRGGENINFLLLSVRKKALFPH